MEAAPPVKARRGRPPRPPEERPCARVVVWVLPGERARVAAAAARAGLSVSAWCRRGLLGHLDQVGLDALQGVPEGDLRLEPDELKF